MTPHVTGEFNSGYPQFIAGQRFHVGNVGEDVSRRSSGCPRLARVSTANGFVPRIALPRCFCGDTFCLVTATADQVLEKIKSLPPADLGEVCQAVLQLTVHGHDF